MNDIFTTKITNKGQITIPVLMRKIINSDIISLTLTENNNILITPVRNIAGSLANSFDPQ